MDPIDETPAGSDTAVTAPGQPTGTPADAPAGRTTPPAAERDPSAVAPVAVAASVAPLARTAEGIRALGGAGTGDSARAGADQGSERTGGPTVTARQAVSLVIVTLLGLLVIDAHGMVRTGRNMEPGWPRTLILGLARPADQVAKDTGLDIPRRLIYAAFGHDDNPGSTSELLSPPTVAGGAAGGAAPAPASGAGAGTGAGAAKGGTSPGSASGQTATGTRASSPAALPPLRHPSGAAPLRLLVTGDSMTNPLGPPLTELAHGTVRADIDTHYSTGLVRPDFFDWAANAHKQVAADHPEAVLLTLGANDGQGFTMPNGDIYSAGSPQWVKEYTRRATILLRIYSQGGRVPIYWMSLPVAHNAKLDGYFRQLNSAITAASRVVPRTRLVDIRDRLSRNGAYSAYLTDDSGTKILARDSDGVHMTIDGSRLAARILLRVIDSDWHISTG
jgi:hypothetical protein